MQQRTWIVLLGIVVGIICAYQIITAVMVSRTTGVLQVTSSDQNALLSITQGDHQAKNIGIGKAKIRLVPGSYYVVTLDNGYETGKLVTVSRSHHTKTTLSLPAAAAFTKSSDLFKLLPYQGPAAQYTITETVETINGVTGPVITITAPNEASQTAALSWIKSQGYTPANYTIHYQQAAVVNYHYTNGLP